MGEALEGEDKTESGKRFLAPDIEKRRWTGLPLG
jgi:hypothetical protein